MIKKYFFTGLLVLVPLIITAWVLATLINTLDQSLLLLPVAWRPKEFLGPDGRVWRGFDVVDDICNGSDSNQYFWATIDCGMGELSHACTGGEIHLL